MAIDQSDVYVFLKPMPERPRAWGKDALVAAMNAKLEDAAPGAGYSFSQPIQMRMQELMEAGVRSDIAVKVYGDDLSILRQKAVQIAAVGGKAAELTETAQPGAGARVNLDAAPKEFC
jgi:cobalt-zinc-cadmium resistance protein CzcA